MQPRTSLAVLALLCAVSSLHWSCSSARDNRLPEGAEAVLRGAGTIEIFALDPIHVSERESSAPSLHGYPILGSATITDHGQRAALVELVLDGIVKSEGEQAFCFDPRHGLRAVHEGRTLELVICYECLSMNAYGDSTGTAAERVTVLTAESVERGVTRIYEGAGLTIAGR